MGCTDRPRESLSKPILVTLRRPDELWSSLVRYDFRLKGTIKELKNHLPSAGAPPVDLFREWVLRRDDYGDVYLCLGSGLPEIHTQLRTAVR